jgi:putative membrane protein
MCQERAAVTAIARALAAGGRRLGQHPLLEKPMNLLPIATACLLALGLAACDKSGQAAQPDRPAPGASSPTADAAPPALQGGDQAFMAKAAGDNAFQIAMARVALRVSQTAPVRELAQRVMDDHTRMNRELATIAARRSTDHPSPPVPVDKAQELQQHLLSLQGDAFDQAFAGVMVNDHRTAIALFTDEIQHGHDEAVREFARKELPALREHMAMANALEARPAPASE